LETLDIELTARKAALAATRMLRRETQQQQQHSRTSHPSPNNALFGSPDRRRRMRMQPKRTQEPPLIESIPALEAEVEKMERAAKRLKRLEEKIERTEKSDNINNEDELDLYLSEHDVDVEELAASGDSSVVDVQE
jgi:hypothetical protein